MRRLTTGLLALAILLGVGAPSAAPSNAASSECEHVVAKWSRDNGSVVTHNPRHAICSDPANYVHHGDDHAHAGVTGDLDGDCDVDLSDLARMLSTVGSQPGDPNWDPHADLDGSGTVDSTDVAILQAHFGLQC